MNGNAVTWFEIPVSDLARAKAFYESVFGARLTRLENPGQPPGMEMWTFPMQENAIGVSGALVKMPGFDAGGNKLWSTQESDEFDLSMGAKTVVNLTLSLPRDEHTRLMVQIVLDDYAVDESFSEWIDT